MSSIQVMCFGAALVLVFDTIAALLSRALGISYARFSVGSWIIYAAIGYFATGFAPGNRIQTAIVAGVSLGVTDATLGWAISWWIGPGKVKGGLTPTRWMIAAAFVIATGAAFSALAGIVARITNHGSQG
jgi:hypothetical protein